MEETRTVKFVAKVHFEEGDLTLIWTVRYTDGRNWLWYEWCWTTWGFV